MSGGLSERLIPNAIKLCDQGLCGVQGGSGGVIILGR